MRTCLSTFRLAILVLAAVSVCGGHWAVFQTVAWSQMLVQNSREAELKAAVIKTFDGQHPCHLCLKIKQGRRTDQKPEQQLQMLKLTLFVEIAAAEFPSPPRSDCKWELRDESEEARGEVPRLEPPRTPGV